ncbi:SDR family oxidoreductase [Nocardia callitridis]|uniref:SDR family oxidoreductase n=1 Tax=Nocardia callitridis TaxID=648753 RepID=A0ABP9JU79_9NOCA
MDLQLTGKTALITGASKGIGLEVARTLAAEGVRVAAAARTITPELAALDDVHPITADLASSTGPTELVEQAIGELGALDILVNNVGGVRPGISHGQRFAEIDDAAWQEALDLNLMSAVRVTRSAIPSLTGQRGIIINISSIGARFAHPPIEYGVAKAALTNLGKALAEDLGPDGVRVLTVSPGPTATRNWTAPDGMGADLAREAGLGLDDFLAALPARMGITTGRLTDPAETAALITFLASSAAGNITGVDYVIDGGVLKTV